MKSARKELTGWHTAKAMRLRAQASLPVLTDFIRTEAHVKFELGGHSYGKGVAPNLRSQVSDDEFDEL